MSNKEINIEEIMGEIRAEIEKKGYTKIDVDKDEIFKKQVSEYDFNAVEFNPVLFERYLAELDTKREVQAYRQLKSRPVVGGIIIFFKKIIRKCTKFYVEPIVESQNEVNELVTQLMIQLNAQVRLTRELESRIDELEIKLNKLEGDK